MVRNGLKASLAAALLLAAMAGSAEAYVGPGAGLSAIGSLVALVGAVVVAMFGFVWFPVKRLLKNMRKAEPQPAAADADPTPEDATATSAQQ